MRSKARNTISVFAIIVLSILIGLAATLVWDMIDRGNHPRDYSDLVSKYSEEYNVPDYIIYAVIKVESDFDPDARSSADARGLMQMTPDTFKWLTSDAHLNEDLLSVTLYDPEVNIRYGTYYLSYLYRKFDYNWDTAFAAYNAGPTRVSQWLEDSEYSDGEGNLTKIPIKQTREYVSKVNSEIEQYKKIYTEK